jgi:DNA-binding MarR family transcriptional regulator
VDRRRSFGFLLKDVSRLSAKNFERHANEVALGLTLEQCKVLVHLDRNQGISQVRLASLTETDPMTLVRILDRMEADGWLERRRDPGDRRVWRLHMKSDAQPVLKKIWAIADHARNESLAGLEASDINQLMDLLERIHGNLAALIPGAVEPERLIKDKSPREIPSAQRLPRRANASRSAPQKTKATNP